MSADLVRSAIASIDWRTGSLAGDSVRETVRTLAELKDVFRDPTATELPPDTVVYRVQRLDDRSGDEGALLWGTTVLEPGVVGDEYFMTHGHFHQKRERGEFYATVMGEGMLVLMDEQRNCWAEKMFPGSLHYVSGATAHRVVNTGEIPLRFVACWASDAGHDYSAIAQQGFGIRVVRRAGVPAVVRSDL